MKIIRPSFRVEESDGLMLQKLEKIGRVCYKSEDRITATSADDFIEMLIRNGHEAMIEHALITVTFVCDRGVSHELVRHRIASFAQESTRYCNYSKDKFGGALTFILPEWFEHSPNTYMDYDANIKAGTGKDFSWMKKEEIAWLSAISHAEDIYLYLIENGWSAQQARAVLPNSVKTEIVMSANPREWRNFFKLRASKKAHPQMQELAYPLLDVFKQRYGVLFSDLNSVREV